MFFEGTNIAEENVSDEFNNLWASTVKVKSKACTRVDYDSDSA